MHLTWISFLLLILLDRFSKGNSCSSPPQITNTIEVIVRRTLADGSTVLVSKGPYMVHDEAEYVCRPGYKRQLSNSRHVCRRGRQWIGAIVCIVSCQRYSFFGVLQNNMICGRSCRSDGDCRGNLKCRCDSHCAGTCVNLNVNCGSALAVNNGDVTYTGSGFGRVAHYRCRDGFFLASGNTAQTCTGGGTWLGKLPVCQRVTCGDPRPSIQATGGNVLNWSPGPYYVGHSFTFFCPRTHVLLGSRERICMKNGRWSGTLTVCSIRERNECDHPGIPINGRISSSISFEVGSIVEFQCNPGYSMLGDSRQECLYFLQWSGGGAPTCINPRYPISDDRVVGKILRRVEDLPSISRAAEGRASNNLEAIFILDVSDDVRDDALQDSLAFATERITNMSQNGRIRAEISAFASGCTRVQELATTSTEDAIDNLNLAQIDRQNILLKIGPRRNTYQALVKLNATLSSTFSEDPDSTRNVFLFVHGPHAEGPSPIPAMNNIRELYEEFSLEIYVIAFGDQFQSEEAINQLTLLAPDGYFLSNPPLDLLKTQLPDSQITDYSKCGKAGDMGELKSRASLGKVIGGAYAIDGAWPWQVVFTLFRPSVFLTYNTQLSVFGGGSLINNQWIVTAAHIFRNVRRFGDWPSNVLITMGVTRLFTNRSAGLPPEARAFLPREVIIHEDYVEGCYDYDIALVRLGREQTNFGDFWIRADGDGFVEYSQHIQRVCLPCRRSNCVGDYLERSGILTGAEEKEERCEIEETWLLQAGAQEEKNVLAAVTGFGKEDEAVLETSSVLKQGLIKLRSRARCQRDRNKMVLNGLPSKIPFSERMICGIGGGQNSPVVDSCTGDSGGPLVREVVDDESGESCWVLVGLVSFGLNCASSYTENNTRMYFPGFYTKVSSLIGWITDRIGEEEPECLKRNLDNLEPGQRCPNDCETDDDCRGSRKRCRCVDACGMSCFNPNARCRNIETFENGVISGNMTIGTNLVYNCDEGYVLEGNNRRFCRSDRSLSGTVPVCQRIECVVPDRPQFGLVIPSTSRFYIGDIVMFSCFEGYGLTSLSGSHLNATCQANGRWSAEVPTCDLQCRVGNIFFGTSSSTRAFINVGETVTYSCIDGYRIQGKEDILCLANGRWSHPLPICTQIYCEIPEAPDFGSVSPTSGRIAIGGTITFTCLPGYEMVDQASNNLIATCQENAVWTRRTPQCREICPRPENPRNGLVVSVPGNKMNFVQGDTVSYSCNLAYCIQGDPERLCEPTGWTTAATCRRGCARRDPPRNGSYLEDNQHWCPGESVRFVCDPNFRLEGDDHSTCADDGSWNRSVPFCRRVEICDKPNNPQNGYTVSNPERKLRFQVGESVRFDCNSGYCLRGNASAMCRRTGWEGEATCARGCPRRDPSPNVFYEEDKQFWCPGEKAKLVCSDPSFRRFGNEYTRCALDGSWETEVLRCSQKCIKPDPPEFGSVVAQTSKRVLYENQYVRYTCNQGYCLQGDEKATCTLTGWDGAPTCIRGCPHRDPPSFGSYAGSRNQFVWCPGDKAEFACSGSHQMVGDRFSMCGSNGQWEGEVPTCRRNVCEVPGHPQAGSVSPSTGFISVGGRISYRCDTGFEISGVRSGSIEAICQADGTWSRGVPSCVRNSLTLKRDIAFLMDESVNVGPDNFDKIKRIVSAYIKLLCGPISLGTSRTRVALTSFDGEVHHHKPLIATNRNLNTNAAHLAGFVQFGINYNSQTQERACLVEALDSVKSRVLRSNGARKGQPNVVQEIVLLTAGCESCGSPKRSVAEAASRLKADGIDVYVIGIALGNICQEELNGLRQGGKCSHFLNVVDWNTDLNAFIENLENQPGGQSFCLPQLYTAAQPCSAMFQ